MPKHSFSRRMFLGLAHESASRPSAQIGVQCLTFHATACESCAEACDSGAIHFTRNHIVKRPFIDAERCSGCGDCLAVCPVSAIEVKGEDA